jgi:hypothetical protein
MVVPKSLIPLDGRVGRNLVELTLYEKQSQKIHRGKATPTFRDLRDHDFFSNRNSRCSRLGFLSTARGAHPGRRSACTEEASSAMLATNNNHGAFPMAIRPRPDLLENITLLVDMAYDVQAATEYPRTLQDKSPLDVIVCLGSGRCMYPSQGAGERHCAFCRRLPSGFIGRERAAETVRQIVGGN